MLPFTIKSTMTRDLYLRFSWKIFRQHKFAMAYLIIMPILILIYCVANGLPIYGIFLASLFLVAMYYLINMKMNRTYNKNPLMQDLESTFAFEEDHVTVTTKRGTLTLNYEDITDIYETKYDIFMMTGKNFGNPFVKKDLTEEEIQFIRSLKHKK